MRSIVIYCRESDAAAVFPTISNKTKIESTKNQNFQDFLTERHFRLRSCLEIVGNCWKSAESARNKTASPWRRSGFLFLLGLNCLGTSVGWYQKNGLISTKRTTDFLNFQRFRIVTHTAASTAAVSSSSRSAAAAAVDLQPGQQYSLTSSVSTSEWIEPADAVSGN